MRYSVYIIDNDIPAAGEKAQQAGIVDTGLLNASNLQFLLNDEKWSDDVLRSLIQKLLTDVETDGVSRKWDVCGLTNPAFCINAINDGEFRADLIVFDWEYPGAQGGSATNSESSLREILDRTFCLVFVFSGADKRDEIEAILSKPDFERYRSRLEYLDKVKPDSDQSALLLAKADDMYRKNFSFKFAHMLRARSVQCADQILSDLGRASLNDVKNLLLVDGIGGKKDFVDFLAERFRASLAGPQVFKLLAEIPDTALENIRSESAAEGKNGGAATATPIATTIDRSVVEKVWSYRLYFHQDPGDDLVRRGDIVELNGKHLLVISADCDLVRFWNKNFGWLNAIALHELENEKKSLIDLLTLCVKPEKIGNRGPHNLIGTIGDLPEGPFVLPFLPTGEGTQNFVGIPKELVSILVPPPDGWEKLTPTQRKVQPLRYVHWDGSKRICTIAEPFLTPVVHHVLGNIGGNGTPDYPEQLKAILKEVLGKLSTAPAIAANTVVVDVAREHPPAVAS